LCGARAFKFKEENLGVLFIEERQLQSKSLEATIDIFLEFFSQDLNKND
jgi:hypothetical protein